jgi:phosphate transport system substrate-binding protein
MSMKKRIFAYIAAVTLLFSFAGCAKPQEVDIAPSVAPQNSTLHLKSLPNIDGSTATIPLSEGIARALLGISAKDAAKVIHHNTTHSAYVNLIEGQADIIFVTAPSEDELKLAADKGVVLDIFPVVREGFVFLVNKENSVKSLTVAQVQDIYQGNITNWKEVGGQDAPIIAYQRPENSGSQTLMLSLVMKDKPIMEPPVELTVSEMSGLMEAVADFDLGKQSIGYSVYYYATDMYEREGARLLAVNGVMPDKKSISTRQYPFTSAYYAVLRKTEKEGSAARKLLAWLLGAEGQKIAGECGYVPLQMQ